MFSKLYKFSKLVMYLNSCSIDLGRDIDSDPMSSNQYISNREWIL